MVHSMEFILCPCTYVRATVIIMAACASTGCTPSGRSDIELPRVSPPDSAAKAIELYDKDANGVLSVEELAACHGILAARKNYDANNDDQLSKDEIAARLTTLFSTGIGLTPVTCTVVRGSAPLDHATVRFVPDPILGDSLKSATGTTDANGTATIAISDADLPADQAGLRAMQPGIYRVEIEHPNVAESTSSLGCEIDPAARGGTEPKFRL
jgi:hypothetical protein